MTEGSRKKAKRETGGFTLVELLVSIAILAIIVVPILTAFISAAKANSKAKRKLEATTAAQNVMENIKAVGVNAYLENLSAAADTDGVYTLDNTDEAATGALIPNQVINNKTFRFKAVFSPADYASYNDQTVANIDDMDVLQDAFYVESEAADQAVVDEYYDEKSNGTESEIISKLTREIDIVITHTGDTASGITKVGVDFIYTLNGDAATEKKVSDMIYDNSDIQGGSLRAVYLFYTPLYAIKDGANAEDTIKIFNNTTSGTAKAESVKTKVYLVKQHTNTTAQTNGESTTTYNVNLEAGETNYKVNLEADELNPNASTVWSPTADYKAYTTIRTNIGYDFDGKTITGGQFASFIYSLNGAKVTNVEDNKKYLAITTLDAPSASKRLYKVTLDVFIAGSNDAVYTMTGTSAA